MIFTNEKETIIKLCKLCLKCKYYKILDDYDIQYRNPDIYRSECKQCRSLKNKLMYLARKEKIKI